MANGDVIGTLEPRAVIQEDTRACLPACLLVEVDPSLDLTEADIIDVMTEDGLFTPGQLGGAMPKKLAPGCGRTEAVERTALCGVE